MGENIKKQSEPKHVYISSKADRCPECSSTNIVRDYDTAEEVCHDCGYVLIENVFDRGPEWRAFDEEERARKARTGAPSTYTVHDKGLPTVIDWHNKDIHGKSLSPGQRSEMYRLRKWNKRIRVSDGEERSKTYALAEINKRSDNFLNLPKNVREQASVNYIKMHKKGLQKGRTILGLSAGSVYLACRQSGVNRTIREIAKAFETTKKEVGHDYRFLLRELDCKVPPQIHSQYVSKFSEQLAVQGKVEGIANEIIFAAREKRLTSGRDPKGVAAAATYIAGVLVNGKENKKTQREIAEACNVTEVTVRNVYKKLMKNLDIDIFLHPQEEQ